MTVNVVAYVFLERIFRNVCFKYKIEADTMFFTFFTRKNTKLLEFWWLRIGDEVYRSEMRFSSYQRFSRSFILNFCNKLSLNFNNIASELLMAIHFWFSTLFARKTFQKCWYFGGLILGTKLAGKEICFSYKAFEQFHPEILWHYNPNQLWKSFRNASHCRS